VSPVDGGALAVACFGLLAVVLPYLGGGTARAGLPMLVELWTAAALLELRGQPGWLTIAVAASAVMLRKFLLPRRRQA
jgi:hypothetical protein